MRLSILSAAMVGALYAATPALAVPVGGTGDVTPDVIFGSGNLNGSFTGVQTNGIELGLRGKLRYNASGLPENTFNYDGDRTYAFDPALSANPADRSLFNFEWSINTDFDGSSGLALDDLTYLLSIDYDPTIERKTTVEFDLINLPFADHAIGTNATLNGDGTVATDPADYSALIAANNVAQNSWNLGFFEPAGFDPTSEGLYTITLSAYDGAGLVAGTSIDVLVGEAAPIPLPAPALLLGSAIAGLFMMRRRRAAA